MTVLVTGAAGFLGQRIVRVLKANGESVVGADRSFGEPESQIDAVEGVESIPLDIAGSEPSSWPRARELTGLIHAAALTPTATQERDDPAAILDVNLVGTIRMLELARRAGVTRFVYVSSSAVYSRPGRGTVDEGRADGGRTLYGSGKLAAEAIVKRYGELFGMSVAMVRPSSVYGPGERWRPSRPDVSIVCSLVEAARTDSPISLLRPKSRREWTYVDDVARAVWLLLARRRPRERIFNVGSGEITSLGAIARVVERLSGRRLVIDPGGGDPSIDGGRSWPTPLSCDRLVDEVGWRPRVGIEAGIARYLAEVGLPQSAAEGR